MCVPTCTGMQPFLHHCGCGCMGFPEIEEEIRMLEDYKKRLENMLGVVERRLGELRKIK